MTIKEKAKEYQEEHVSFLTGKGGASDIILAFVRGAMEATRWISVNESLPEHHPEMMLKESEEDLKYEQSKDVLVKYANGATDTGLRYRFLTMDDEYTDLSFSWSCCGEVTHWRPIEPEIM